MLLCLCPGRWGSVRTLGSRAHMQARGKQLPLQCEEGDAPQAVPCREGKRELLPASPCPPLRGCGAVRCGSCLRSARCLRLALRHSRRCPSLLSSALPTSSRHAIKQAVKGSSQAARSARKFIKERRERLKFGHCKSWCRAAVGLDGGNLCSSRP